MGLQGGRRILDNGDTNYFYGDDGFQNVHLCQNLSNCIFKYVQCIIICQIILPLRYLGIFLCFFKGYILFNSINMIYMQKYIYRNRKHIGGFQELTRGEEGLNHKVA